MKGGTAMRLVPRSQEEIITLAKAWGKIARCEICHHLMVGDVNGGFSVGEFFVTPKMAKRIKARIANVAAENLQSFLDDERDAFLVEHRASILRGQAEKAKGKKTLGQKRPKL